MSDDMNNISDNVQNAYGGNIASRRKTGWSLESCPRCGSEQFCVEQESYDSGVIIRRVVFCRNCNLNIGELK